MALSVSLAVTLATGKPSTGKQFVCLYIQNLSSTTSPNSYCLTTRLHSVFWVLHMEASGGLSVGWDGYTTLLSLVEAHSYQGHNHKFTSSWVNTTTWSSLVLTWLLAHSHIYGLGWGGRYDYKRPLKAFMYQNLLDPICWPYPKASISVGKDGFVGNSLVLKKISCLL